MQASPSSGWGDGTSAGKPHGDELEAIPAQVLGTQIDAEVVQIDTEPNS
jgi:hypothetical protein